MTENTIKSFYTKGNVYNTRAPYYIQRTELTEEEWYRLTESKTFCMLPWVHLHAFPDGRAYPCCLSDYWHPIGDLHKDTMKEVWNQDPLKQMRVNMLADKPCKQCNKCYEQEENGAFSMRNNANRNNGHHVKEINQTHADGTHPEFKIRYWDIRFNNLCNFRCRSCGPMFSSNWYNDHVKMYGKPPDALGRPLDRVEYAGRNEDDIEDQMQEHIPYLEEVYFAGGEPLIMKEHYTLLDKLLELGKTDIVLRYNTNFSELQYKNKHVFDYWKQFKNVSVGASLDASGARAELMRKGTVWSQIVKNRELMMKEVPHVDFYVSATVSSMNVLHVLDFHREWVELGLIKVQDWNINICQSPNWYRADIFPTVFKETVIYPAYEKHIAWLEPFDKLKRAVVGYQSLMNLMKSNDSNQNWSRFIKEIAKLDQVRNEDFWKTFPEIKCDE